MLLYPSLNVTLRLAQIEASAVRDFTRDFIYASGGSAGEAVAAVCAFPIDFELAGAVARAWTEVDIRDAPHKYSPEIP